MLKKSIKKCIFIIVFLLLIVSVILPTTYGDSIQELSASEVSTSKYENISLLKWIKEPGSYSDYMENITIKPLVVKKIKDISCSSYDSLILILVKSNVIEHLHADISMYSYILEQIGIASIVLEVDGGTIIDLRNLITSYWISEPDLEGVVLIGEFPSAWYDDDMWFDPPFPCDLFLMDLDGIWYDLNHDGIYDSHSDGDGDTAPEIYLGRIDASKVPGDEITIIQKYLHKIHEFWTGGISHTNVGLTYTGIDWKDDSELTNDIKYAYDDYQAIIFPSINRYDYINKLSSGSFEFIQLASHSWSGGHFFLIGGGAFSEDIRSAPPTALFYNLFCCGALRFTDDDCVGNAYILNTNSPSLTVVGSTKTGSMLEFKEFYKPLGQGYSIGKAFHKWFESQYPYDPLNISWYYGMTILGDPTLIPRNPPIISPSNSPLKPDIPKGPTSGRSGVDYEYSCLTTDPDDDIIYYIFDWGDGTDSGWIGPYDSGENCIVSHTWDEQGSYQVKVSAKDITGAKSDWSDPLSISMTKDKAVAKLSFIQFIEKLIARFPILVKILNVY